MLKTKKEWITIKVLTEQYEEIEKLIPKNHDYISVPEFYRVAANKELKRLKK